MWYSIDFINYRFYINDKWGVKNIMDKLVEFRKLKRKGRCRFCSKSIKREDVKVFIRASLRETIILCNECVCEMSNILNIHKKDKNNVF